MSTQNLCVDAHNSMSGAITTETTQCPPGDKWVDEI